MSLADTQAATRQAVVSGATTTTLPALVGGLDPIARLSIHQRHYRATLVSTLLTRFPALAWLVGERRLADAAEAFVRAHPPAVPCLAEYGQAFPAFATRALGESLDPYFTPFGDLEWHVGLASIAIDLPIDLDRLGALADDELPNLTLTTQPGTFYLRTDWPVHDLFEHFATSRDGRPRRSAWRCRSRRRISGCCCTARAPGSAGRLKRPWGLARLVLPCGVVARSRHARPTTSSTTSRGGSACSSVCT